MPARWHRPTDGNITGRSVVSGTQWVTRTYYYSDSAHAHAVTGPANGWEFDYDGNGNMTGREDRGSYIQAFDVENPASLRSRDYSRLVAVTDTQTLSVTRFIYDGDGNRVLTIYPDGSQTAFVGDHYEVEGGTARSYYYFGSQRVAMRVDDGASEEVYWFHTDLPSTSLRTGPSAALRTGLGSTSLLSTITGTLAAGSETRFLPYGEYRVEPQARLTDHGFTGHKQQDQVGLIYMRARYYVQGVGRFASADSVAAGPTSPQDLNRYAYVRNSPVRYWDPSGHYLFENDPSQKAVVLPKPPSPLLPATVSGLTSYGEDAWNGLQTIQAQTGAWWGSRLDAEEATLIFLNHEFGNLCLPGGSAPYCLPQAVVDVVVNRYTAYCSGGPWSAGCLNGFWGYSQVITEPRVDQYTSGDRYDDTDVMAGLRVVASDVLDNRGQAQSDVMHWANIADDKTARTTYFEWQAGDRTYVTWAHPYRNGDGEIINLFAIQTIEQHALTGGLVNWRR